MELASWQNFYILVGTASATLIGLMFVAVTFGASYVSVEEERTVRSFLDPTFTHFVQVLLTSCLMEIPSIDPVILGGILFVISVLRAAALVRVHRAMKEAQRKHDDIELSDWISGIVVPLLAHVGLMATSVAIASRRETFGWLAIVTIVILLNGIYGAWELLLWLALTRAKKKRAHTKARASRS